MTVYNTNDIRLETLVRDSADSHQQPLHRPPVPTAAVPKLQPKVGISGHDFIFPELLLHNPIVHMLPFLEHS